MEEDILDIHHLSSFVGHALYLWKMEITDLQSYTLSDQNVEDIIVFLGLKVLNSDISYDSLH